MVLPSCSSSHNDIYSKRVWCIYKIYTVIESCQLSIIMPSRKKVKFMNVMLSATATVDKKTTSNIIRDLMSLSTKTRIEYGQTLQLEDKAMILRYIDATTAYGNVNTTVNTYMKKWVDDVLVKETLQSIQTKKQSSSLLPYSRRSFLRVVMDRM